MQYWFVLKFTYNVCFLLYRRCLCLLVLLNIQIPVQETALNINHIISQSHFQTPRIILATREHQDTAVTRVPPLEILPIFVFAWCILFIMHLWVTAQHFVPISTAFIQVNFLTSGSFHLFKRKSATLNATETTALSCRISILPGGNRTKTCLTEIFPWLLLHCNPYKSTSIWISENV